MVYLHDWTTKEEMIRDFGIQDSEVEGVNVIVASYTYEDYSGDAYVLFEKDGKLFEVHGGHCSCYGLSENNYSGSTGGQWQPEQIEIEALKHRVEKGYWNNDVLNEVKEYLNTKSSEPALSF